MKKIISKKVIFWTLGTLIVMFVGSLVAMNYAANYVLHSIIASSELKPSLAVSTEVSQGSGATASITANPQPSSPLQSKAQDNGAINKQNYSEAESNRSKK